MIMVQISGHYCVDTREFHGFISFNRKQNFDGSDDPNLILPPSQMLPKPYWSYATIGTMAILS